MAASLWLGGDSDTDLVYIIITAHMDISDGAFNKPLLGKNIRFTPTNSSNPILIPHSCGLGGKYWCKHTEAFQAEHKKAFIRKFISVFFVDSAISSQDKADMPLNKSYSISFLIDLLLRPLPGHSCSHNEVDDPDAPLKVRK